MDVVVGLDALGDEREADLALWLVADGAAVEEGQPVAELETAKVTVEIVAATAGVIRILVGAGEVVHPGMTIARVE